MKYFEDDIRWIRDYTINHMDEIEDPNANPWEMVYACLVDENTSATPWRVYKFLVEQMGYPAVADNIEVMHLNKEKADKFTVDLGKAKTVSDFFDKMWSWMEHNDSAVDDWVKYLPNLVDEPIDNNGLIIWYMCNSRVTLPSKHALDKVREALGV